MTRLIQSLLRISDSLGWLVVTFGVAEAALYPIAGPIHARMNGYTLSLFQIFATSFLSLVVALGGYLVTRRRPIGVVAICLLSFIWIAQGLFAFALSYLGVVLLIFGTPFLLMYLQVHGTHAQKPEP